MRARFDLPHNGRYKPIGGYGIIGNTRTSALVGFDGSIDWCCLPKFDSPSVFGAILDWRRAGRWAIQPTGRAVATQAYIPETNILRTEFDAAGSRVTLTDFMPCSVSDEEWSTPPEIHRVVRCLAGEMSMRFTFDPVFEYGRRVPRMTESTGGLALRAGKEEMALSWQMPFEKAERGVAGTFRVARGEELTFVLSYGEPLPRAVKEYRTGEQYARTQAFWRDWVGRLRYEGRWRESVIRSALTLKLFVYSKSGAIIAAPTTSLPERLGGDLNWDYRYSWIRDSASSLWAFHVLGYESETEAYLRWLADDNPSLDLDLRLMYDILGGTKVRESVRTDLEGYMGSKPVRLGNAAAKQRQLDVYGYMLDSLYFSSKGGSTVTDEMYFRFVKPLANFIMDHWGEPGNGIWEKRGKKQHYVYSKAWCWAGLDRAIKIADATGHSEDATVWKSEGAEIKAEVLSKGWSEERQSLVMHYGSSSLDASNLMLPLIGFIDANHPKMKRTIEAIDKELSHGALVYRYRDGAGRKYHEGAFLLCGFWMVACLAKIGRVSEAAKRLDDLILYSNHLGLLSEEVDPRTGEALGNFPQAFSHIGLIMGAHDLNESLTSNGGSQADKTK